MTIISIVTKQILNGIPVPHILTSPIELSILVNNLEKCFRNQEGFTQKARIQCGFYLNNWESSRD
jgi:hypothetical protein